MNLHITQKHLDDARGLWGSNLRNPVAAALCERLNDPYVVVTDRKIHTIEHGIVLNSQHMTSWLADWNEKEKASSKDPTVERTMAPTVLYIPLPGD